MLLYVLRCLQCSVHITATHLDLVVDDCVDGDGDAVLGEDLLRRHVEGHGAQVDDGDGVDAGDDEEQAGADRALLAHAAQAEDHRALVFLKRYTVVD